MTPAPPATPTLFAGSDSMSLERFLEAHWQRAPLFLPGALPEPLPDPTALVQALRAAGPELELRQVRAGQGGLEIEAVDGDALRWPPAPGESWLVNGADHHAPVLRPLRQRFQVTPAWQIDDLMLSLCADGAGVGPHSDRYDVFLVQLSGHKAWQLDRDALDRRAGPDPGDLARLTDFVASDAFEAAPGDVLYLPPGVGHWGRARGTGITLSVGFRAPALRDVLALAGTLPGTDAPLALPPPRTRDGAFGKAELDALRTALQRWIEQVPDDGLRPLLGTLLSESRYDQWIDARQADDPDPGSPPATLRLHADARLAWSRQDGTGAVAVFANGEYLGDFALAQEQLAALQGGAPLPLTTPGLQELARALQARGCLCGDD